MAMAGTPRSGFPCTEDGSRVEHRTACLSKPLCRYYAFVQFRSVGLALRDGQALTATRWCWALGMFNPCQYEVLGAWRSQHDSGEAAQDLHDRGILQIGVLAAGDTVDFAAHYPEAATWPQTGGETANLPQSAPERTFGPRHCTALRSAAATADRLQARLARAIKQQAPFASEASAAAFLAHHLEKANRSFWPA